MAAYERIERQIALTRIIHDRFYCNRLDETKNHCEGSDSRAEIHHMALDLASAVATRRHTKSNAKCLSAAS